MIVAYYCNNMLTTLLSRHAIHILSSSFFPLLSIQLSINICFVVMLYRGKYKAVDLFVLLLRNKNQCVKVTCADCDGETVVLS